MTSSQLAAFVVFTLVASGTPGPSNVILTATGANVGVLRGLPTLLGVSAGMGAMMFLVAVGLGTLVVGHPGVLRVLNVLGAALLLWLAWKIATARGGQTLASARPVGFLGAAAFQWVNPKSWLICVSAVGAYMGAAGGVTLGQAAAFGGVFTVASIPGLFVWLAFGAAMQRLLRSERAVRVFNVVMGALLAASLALALT